MLWFVAGKKWVGCIGAPGCQQCLKEHSQWNCQSSPAVNVRGNVDWSFCTKQGVSGSSTGGGRATIDWVMASSGWRGSVKQALVTDCMENIDWMGRKCLPGSGRHSPLAPPQIFLPRVFLNRIQGCRCLFARRTRH